MRKPSTPTLPKRPDLRADCAWLLYQILEEGRSSRDCLAQVQSRHSHQNNAWIQEMAFGVLRRLPQLQLWLRDLLDKPLKGDKKIIEHLLLVGFYQLAFSRVAEHAAVSETVNATQALGAPGLKGLVNAVMRNFMRRELGASPSTDPLIESGLPKWLFDTITTHYPGEQADILANMNRPGPVWLRVNTLKITRDAFCQHLSDAGISYTVPEQTPDGLILNQRCDIPGLPGYDDGWFAVQDGAAQLAAYYLDAQPGERVLDCCAAPGGKTAHVAQRCPDAALILALDNSEVRLQRVRENLQRLGLTDSVTVTCADALTPEAWHDGRLFDRILLDAPCSATGVIRRHPDIRWHRKKADIAQLVEIQRMMLETLWPLLSPGGTLLYATCSILPEENSAQIADFIRRHNDAQHLPLTDKDTTSQPGRQILPGQSEMDGFYYARLIKSKEISNKGDTAS
ncbi:16S rRNA (cytosine(967)-C(5))-methyltransferase RsmB [Alteromonas sp. CYL-A6]|uniref:16S rRNA (cytosine(967)-C(5))-methyltransferase RsmB n=1 Tax=Alteromonas nitratireducens TaxID=3390813 RepID=UPI0034AB71D3